ncbi:hypothetical protein [Nocardioides sp. zg-1230]|uniref:5-methylcytosine restriction system specificity protein McrC n=1 Tax=Nocardioides sp. zg-1230 TaxID=2736601 RepID=UPI0034647ED2
MATYLTALMAVLAEGVPFEYESKRDNSSAPRGSFDMSGTIREFAARGIAHRAVSHVSIRHTDQDIVSLCQRVSEMVRDLTLASEQESATMAQLLDGIRTSDRVQETDEDSRTLALRISSRYPERPDVLHLVATCEALLNEEHTGTMARVTASSGSYRFADADALWERAVHAAFQTALAGRAGFEVALHPLRGSSTPLFSDGGPDIDPDVIVFRDGHPWMVVDAKDYLAASPDPSGVYQVYAYAKHLQIEHAALAYLAADRPWQSKFGDNGVAIHSLAVSPKGPGPTLPRLESSARRVLNEILDTDSQLGGNASSDRTRE